MSEIPSAVVRFISHHIESVEEVEVLLLLREQSPRAWTPDEISRELRATASAIELRLQKLAGHGLVRVEDEIRFSYDSNNEFDGDIGELAKAYRTRRTRVIEAIFKRPSRDVESFSDAFRLRREED